jgi:hypothetical protein
MVGLEDRSYSCDIIKRRISKSIFLILSWPGAFLFCRCFIIRKMLFGFSGIYWLQLHHVKLRNLSEPAGIFTDWERFQSLASDFISPRNKVSSEEKADKLAHDVTASIASAYTLSNSKATLSGLHKDLPGLDRLLKQKQALRKLWHETGDLTCKTAVYWIVETIRRIASKKAH